MALREVYWSSVFLTLCACSSVKSPEGPPQVAEGSANSAEEQCLDDANADRVPSPTAPERIEVAHVLVRHRELKDSHGSTRSRSEACLRALSALEALQGGATWNGVVDEYSDSGHADHGSLGRVSRDELSPRFADAAFALSSQELSYVVESDRGFHIILRND